MKGQAQRRYKDVESPSRRTTLCARGILPRGLRPIKIPMYGYRCSLVEIYLTDAPRSNRPRCGSAESSFYYICRDIQVESLDALRLAQSVSSGCSTLSYRRQGRVGTHQVGATWKNGKGFGYHCKGSEGKAQKHLYLQTVHTLLLC